MGRTTTGRVSFLLSDSTRRPEQKRQGNQVLRPAGMSNTMIRSLTLTCRTRPPMHELGRLFRATIADWAAHTIPRYIPVAVAAFCVHAPAHSTGAENTQVPFRTKHAFFQPSAFAALPGWSEDRLSEAWQAFRESCKVVGRRPVWSDTCDRARSINARHDGEVRAFFEREFAPYHIRELDQSPAGVITGYFEPLLSGSRKYGKPYLYPVYAQPTDLVLLDSRRFPASSRGRLIPARIEGIHVVPLPDGAPDATHSLDLGNAFPITADRKLRLRVEGKRITPYPSRMQIESGPLTTAQVLAWVDNPVALYSMQIQGSGKIRLTDGSTIRVGYAEQNGHPFTPSLAFLGYGEKKSSQSAQRPPLTRGLGALAEAEEAVESEADGNGPADDDPSLVTRSIGVRGQAAPGYPPRPIAGNSPEVRRMIELLRPKQRQDAQAPSPEPNTSGPVATVPPQVPVAAAPPRNEKRPPVALDLPIAKAAVPAPPLPHASTGTNGDPSFVFFRPIPNDNAGPIGALGVPLTAGRSVAVDPRTTPLGAPVFLSTTQPGRAGSLNRLVLAQDTGGAIRGAVRADFFWGFGANAGAAASRMKELGQMWVLLPKELKLDARSGILTRSLKGGGVSSDSDCLVEDDEFCVEEEP